MEREEFFKSLQPKKENDSKRKNENVESVRLMQEAYQIISSKKYTPESIRILREYLKDVKKRGGENRISEKEVAMIRIAILRTNSLSVKTEDLRFFLKLCIQTQNYMQAITLINHAKQSNDISVDIKRRLDSIKKALLKSEKVKTTIDYLQNGYSGTKLGTNEIASLVGLSEIDVIQIYKQLQKGEKPLKQLEDDMTL